MKRAADATRARRVRFIPPLLAWQPATREPAAHRPTAAASNRAAIARRRPANNHVASARSRDTETAAPEIAAALRLRSSRRTLPAHASTHDWTTRPKRYHECRGAVCDRARPFAAVSAAAVVQDSDQTAVARLQWPNAALLFRAHPQATRASR